VNEDNYSGEHRARDDNEGASVEPVITCENELQIARALYRMLVSKYPDRLVMLCDNQKRVLARSDQPETVLN
jgi:hypothetical protein